MWLTAADVAAASIGVVAGTPTAAAAAATVNQPYTILVHGFLVVKEEKRANKNVTKRCERHRRR